jgi:8-oxo-dGTP pyrophosphatase MutT (NUDIX family)
MGAPSPHRASDRNPLWFGAMSAPEPRPASTVILCRPEGGSLAIFMVKRHGRSGFMAGAHVFPGGRVDDADHEYGVLDDMAADLVDGSEDAIGFCVAAVRETLEECGVLLAVDELGARPNAAIAKTLFDAVHDDGPQREGSGPREFHSELQALGLVPDISSLRPWSWWITPEAEPKRYDTRFFLAEAPAHDARADLKETTEGDWFTPEAALAAYAAGEIFLAPPTLATLEDLRGFATVAEAAASVTRPLPPICPLISTGEDGMVLALPGDELHEVSERAMAARTRIVMNDEGRFESR